jgi:hypothetical protein
MQLQSDFDFSVLNRQFPFSTARANLKMCVSLHRTAGFLRKSFTLLPTKNELRVKSTHSCVNFTSGAF